LNGTGKPKYLEKNYFKAHFVQQKSNIGSKSGLRGEKPAVDHMSFINLLYTIVSSSPVVS